VYQDVHLRKAAHRYQRCCSWWNEIGGQSTYIAHDLRGSKAREFRILGAGGTELEPATCGVGGQGSQSLAAALRFSDRKLH
jgi:hypothetical protein